MKTRKAAYAASAGLILGLMTLLTGCDLSGGDGGGGGTSETTLARVDPRTYMPQYIDVAKSVTDGAKPATDSSSDCGGRVTFDGDKKCKDSTAVTVPDNSGQQAQQPQLQPSKPADKPKTEVPTPEAAACQEVLKAHGQMGQGTCLHHASTALVFAGARSIFTTRPDMKSMLEMAAGTAISYALAALTGWGALPIIAKIGYALLFAGGLLGFLSTLRDAWHADSDRRHTAADSKEHADAVWRESRLVAMLVLMLLSAVGPKALQMLKGKAPATAAAAAAEAEPAAGAAASAAKPAQKLLGTKQITDPKRLLTAGTPAPGIPGAPIGL